VENDIPRKALLYIDSSIDMGAARTTSPKAARAEMRDERTTMAIEKPNSPTGNDPLHSPVISNQAPFSNLFWTGRLD
jgi:hypothetical protein